MSVITLQNPYAAILSAIWGMIIKITQPIRSRLGYCLVPFETIRDVTYEYNTESGFAEPFVWLHPGKWGCGVKKNLPGYVYLIRAVGTNRYKIGRSINLQTRLQQLQRQSPYPLEIVKAFKTSNPSWDEASLHETYKDYKVYGEWFEFDENYYKSTVRYRFWSHYEESRVADLAQALAKSQGIDWESLKPFHPDRDKYIDEASRYLKVDLYDATAHLGEVCNE